MIRAGLAAVAGVVSALAVAPGAAGADQVRILVAVGHERGADGERPLRYPAADVARVAQVMQALGGVAPENTVLLQDPAPAALDEGLARAERLARRHPPGQVTLFFYFSGHGDRDTLHLGAAEVEQRALAARLARIPAALRVVIVDACRTTQRARHKGVGSEPGFAISLAPPAGAVGTVWLHASSDGETAQESEDLGGAVFTHYLLSGLRGAADGDGDRRVTLDEAYQFSYAYTLMRTLPGTVQRPTATLDVREAGPIVLTEIAGREGASIAWLQLPSERDVRYLVFARRSQTIVTELWSRPERASDIAVAPGSYLIQRRPPGSRGGAAEVRLAAGERRALAPGDFLPVATEALVHKGGELRLRPHEIELGGGAVLGDRLAPGARLFARYAFEWGAWALGVGTGAVASWRTTPAYRVRERALGADLRLERRWSRDPWRLRLGAGLAVQWLEQRARRLDADRVGSAGYQTEQRFHAVAAGATLLAGLRRELTTRLWVEVSLPASALLARSGAGLVLRPEAGVAVGVGITF